jgi:ABC-2 type transport system permease protein
MNKIWTIAHKELSVYFRSPLAYIMLIMTISVFNIFFYMIIDQNREATLKDVFLVMEFMFLFLIPLLTMRLFAEEKAAGTMEFLMTTPTTNTAIVLGKYLGSLLFFTLIILLTGVYYLIIEFYGEPDRLAAFSGYLGIWLEGAMFIAIGMLVSSLTKSQTIAAITAYVGLFLLYFSLSFVEYLTGPAESIVRALSTMTHFANFAGGLISLADIVYYLSIIFFCVSLTRLSIETKLWH